MLTGGASGLDSRTPELFVVSTIANDPSEEQRRAIQGVDAVPLFFQQPL